MQLLVVCRIAVNLLCLLSPVLLSLKACVLLVQGHVAAPIFQMTYLLNLPSLGGHQMINWTGQGTALADQVKHSVPGRLVPQTI